MLITPHLAHAPTGGRALLSQLHLKCLEAILADRLVVQALDPAKTYRWRSRPDAFRGYIDGITPDAEASILNRVREESISRVFLDGSNLGRLARAIKKTTARVEVLTFFHNVEARFFFGALKQYRSAHALGVLAANYASERMAVRYSDRLIALSTRDSAGIARLYGRAGTDVLPMAIEDKLCVETDLPQGAPQGDYALFVGGGFYANQSGIRWFVENVVPEVSLQTCIVGRGLEVFPGELERGGMVNVVGAVDKLGHWYRNAKVVIAPIFDGSGMKTKVAEALMYGKRIIGTREAFSGYEDIADQVGWVCNTKEEFVSAIRSVERMSYPQFEHSLRRIYEREHSFDAALDRLALILGSTPPARPPTGSSNGLANVKLLSRPAASGVTRSPAGGA
jgi:glycosyltransferase involved in cell wall biosynthesis